LLNVGNRLSDHLFLGYAHRLRIDLIARLINLLAILK
jgi:hypothetical protein